MGETESREMHLACKIAAAFGALPNVEAVALGGSQATGDADPDSDTDLYVYTTAAIPVADREAIRRNDSVSVNHRLTELLASYFDVVFAVNRVLHPGEKRLLELVPEHCAKTPANMQAQVERVLRASASGQQVLIATIDDLMNGLDRLLLEEEFDLPGGG